LIQSAEEIVQSETFGDFEKSKNKFDKYFKLIITSEEDEARYIQKIKGIITAIHKIKRKLELLNDILNIDGKSKTVVEFIIYCHSLYKNIKTDEKYVKHIMRSLNEDERKFVQTKIVLGSVQEARTPTKVTKSNIFDLVSLIFWTNEYAKNTDPNNKKTISIGLMDILSKLKNNVGMNSVASKFYNTIYSRVNEIKRGRKPGQTKKQEKPTGNDVSDSDIETSQTQDTQPRNPNPDLPESIKKSVPESRSAVLKGILSVL
jgi:hypothetical protein